MANIYNYTGPFHDPLVDGNEWVNTPDYSYYKSYLLEDYKYSISGSDLTTYYHVDAADQNINACVFGGVLQAGFLYTARFRLYGTTRVYLPTSWVDPDGGNLIESLHGSSSVHNITPVVFNAETCSFNDDSYLSIENPFTSSDIDTSLYFNDNSRLKILEYGSCSGVGTVVLSGTSKIEYASPANTISGLTISFSGSENAIGFHNGFNKAIGQAYIDSTFAIPGDYSCVVTSEDSGWIAPTSNVEAIQADPTWFPECICTPTPFVIYNTGKFGVSSVADYNNSLVASISFDSSCTAAAIAFYAGFSLEIGNTFSNEWAGGPFTTIMETEDSGWIAPTSNVEAIQADPTWFPSCMPGVNMADISYADVETLLRLEIDDVEKNIWSDPDLSALFYSFLEGLKARNPLFTALDIPVDSKWKQAAVYFIAMRCFSSQVEGGNSQTKMNNYTTLYEKEMAFHGFVK